MTALAHIALGSNLGDREAILRSALDRLSERPEMHVRAVSSFHETPPVGGPPGQGPFLNAAAAIETTCTPDELHAALLATEQQAGRVRRTRWGERTLDLDLLLYNDLILESPQLIVPHPRMAFRRFVLGPLAEIASQAIEPITGQSVGQLLDRLDHRPGLVALHGPDQPDLLCSVHRLLLERLDAAGPMPLNTPGGLPSEPDLADRLLERLHILQTLANSPAWPPERWLLADFDPANLVESSATPPLSPTFVVRLDRPTLSSLRGQAPYPSLLPESSDPESIVSEILAACSASRP